MSDGGSSYPQGLFGRQDSFWLVRNGREHDLSKYYAFPWYTTDRVWVPENGTPQLLQYVLYIVLAWNSYSTWWEPLCMLRKAVAYIRTITLLGLIELGSHQLCLLAMVILVNILVLNQLPPIGGELGVQILKLIR